MKLLLTGEPRSGKTTLLENFITAIPDRQGFLTKEIKENGERVGFELVSSHGQSMTLAHVNSTSQLRVSRYGVEIEQLDKFIAALPKIHPGKLLYIDEIGQMELFSDAFTSLVESYLQADNPFVGTISWVYSNEFTEAVLTRDDVIVLKIDAENRAQVSDILNSLALNIPLFKIMSPQVSAKITVMAKEYIQAGQYTQLRKLFKNAIKYVAEKRIQSIGDDNYQIKGLTKVHQVSRINGHWSCDCDLYSGKGSYFGNPGECSHIQSVKLFSA